MDTDTEDEDDDDASHMTPPPRPVPRYSANMRPPKKRRQPEWDATHCDGHELSASAEALPRLLNAPTLPRSPRKKRRYPTLLAMDANGVPCAARSLKQPVALPPRIRAVLRDELSRVHRSANARFHIKMNLRGRTKLEGALSRLPFADRPSGAVALEQLALPCTLLDRNIVTVRAALACMRNTQLRVVEALLARLNGRDGAANWAFIADHATLLPHTQLPDAAAPHGTSHGDNQ